jgi:hypothetical protein
MEPFTLGHRHEGEVMRRRILWMLPIAVAAAGTAVALANDGAVNYTDVPAANVKAAGFAPASVLSPELRQVMVAQGSMRLDGAQDPVGCPSSTSRIRRRSLGSTT